MTFDGQLALFRVEPDVFHSVVRDMECWRSLEAFSAIPDADLHWVGVGDRPEGRVPDERQHRLGLTPRLLVLLS
jgi:hypothetical protein